MPNKPLRPCRHPGCTRLVPGGYCEEHRPKRERGAKSAEWHRWYGLPIWKDELRPAQLLREPFCRKCSKRGLRVLATDVDHIVPHRGNWALFIDPKNHESLCHSCHSRKTIEEMRAEMHKK